MKAIITLFILAEFIRDLRHGDLHGWRSWTRLTVQILTLALIGYFYQAAGWDGVAWTAFYYCTFRGGFFNPATGYVRREDWDHLGDTPVDNIAKRIPSKWIRAAIYVTLLALYLFINP